ncbi:MAG: hypothetical protein QOJ35_514 [Solirubrobacteraceae bacterium]|jgi:hypothetical protein|nr:hypothetical protein [Solirubrobacteraceae bacterium]
MMICKKVVRPAGRIAALTAGAVFVLGAPATASALTPVSSDPFTNASSQHATEVEPDTFANGTTVLSAVQVGRFFDGGSTDIGVSLSTDGGSTWSPSFLPGLTATSGTPGTTGGAFERVSDPSVAYDAAHGVWLVSSIPLTSTRNVPYVFVSRSTTGGTTWSDPVIIPPPPVRPVSVNLDKNWTACDNTASSPFYGHCYTEFDNFGERDLEYMSTSVDGGVTWSTPISPAGRPHGLGGQPVVQPDGTVIVPFESTKGTIAAFSSTDGGQSWTKAVTISRIAFHPVAGDLRTSPLPTAEIDGSGNVYVAWEDCRFRSKCSSNDIVVSTSSDGVAWSAAARVPIDAATSTVDHFIPGLGVDPATSGAGAHLALTYYYYPDAACTAATCQLDVGYVSSPDAGAHWGVATQLAGPMSLSDIASTSQGPMVGDYISTSFTSGGTAATVFAVGTPATAFDEAMYAPSPLTVATASAATQVASSTGVRAQPTGQGVGDAHHAIHEK